MLHTPTSCCASLALVCSWTSAGGWCSGAPGSRLGSVRGYPTASCLTTWEGKTGDREGECDGISYSMWRQTWKDVGLWSSMCKQEPAGPVRSGTMSVTT
jgi:hypothetical protein